MTESETDQTAPERSAFMPVSVPDQDRILVRKQNVFVAVVGVRAYPHAIMFQLLVKVRRLNEDQQPLNIAPDLAHLLMPGDFDFGADVRDPTGVWHPTKVHFAGGGGGTDPADESHYEYKWWIQLSAEDRGLRLWCSWEAGGVPRSEAELDINRLRTASHASHPAWLEAAQ